MNKISSFLLSGPCEGVQAAVRLRDGPQARVRVPLDDPHEDA